MNLSTLLNQMDVFKGSTVEDAKHIYISIFTGPYIGTWTVDKSTNRVLNWRPVRRSEGIEFRESLFDTAKTAVDLALAKFRKTHKTLLSDKNADLTGNFKIAADCQDPYSDYFKMPEVVAHLLVVFSLMGEVSLSQVKSKLSKNPELIFSFFPPSSLSTGWEVNFFTYYPVLSFEERAQLARAFIGKLDRKEAEKEVFGFYHDWLLYQTKTEFPLSVYQNVVDSLRTHYPTFTDQDINSFVYTLRCLSDYRFLNDIQRFHIAMKYFKDFQRKYYVLFTRLYQSFHMHDLSFDRFYSAVMSGPVDDLLKWIHQINIYPSVYKGGDGIPPCVHGWKCLPEGKLFLEYFKNCDWFMVYRIGPALFPRGEA